MSYISWMIIILESVYLLDNSGPIAAQRCKTNAPDSSTVVGDILIVGLALNRTY